MKSTTVLRALVVAEIVLLGASVLAMFLPKEMIPVFADSPESPGADLLARISEAAPATVTCILGALLVVFVVAYVASLIGLLLLKPWSRPLYVISFAIGVCTHLFMKPALVGPISGTIWHLGAACSGAILAVLFLSDAKAIFGGRAPAP